MLEAARRQMMVHDLPREYGARSGGCHIQISPDSRLAVFGTLVWEETLAQYALQ